MSNAAYTVMVVDDDPSVLACYERLLRRSGYATRVHSDPRDVLAEPRGLEGVDLLLLDYKMPGMDGLSLLSELRRRACAVRCVLISAFLNDSVRQKAEVLGVERVLEKPLDADVLRGLLAAMLPSRGQRPATANG